MYLWNDSSGMQGPSKFVWTHCVSLARVDYVLLLFLNLKSVWTWIPLMCCSDTSPLPYCVFKWASELMKPDFLKFHCLVCLLPTRYLACMSHRLVLGVSGLLVCRLRAVAGAPAALNAAFCRGIGARDAGDSFISSPLRFLSDIRVGLQLIMWLLVRVYFSLQEFSGPTVQSLHREWRQMVVPVVRVGWIILGNGASWFADCRCTVKTFFESRAVYYFSGKIPLNSHCYPQQLFFCWWMENFAGLMAAFRWRMKSHFLYLGCGKVLSDHNMCYRDTT